MQNSILRRINSLLQYLENQDISLTTRRLMDLCYDYTPFQSYLPQATKIRADYNIKRGLGEGEIKGIELDAFKNQLTELIRKISEVELTELEVGTSEHIVQLNAQDVRKNFVNRGHVFELGPISFDLKLGEITGIVGENGNGKTTLLRILAQDLAKDSGVVDYKDLNHLQSNPFLLKHRIGFIPQRLEKWNGTLLENLKYSTAIHGYPADMINQRVEFVIHRLGLTRFQNLTWKQLSSGYKLRFELAKTWVWNPKVMILDEPIANLDLYAQQLFLQDLTHMAESSRNPMTVILSSQQLHEIEEISKQLIFLRNGKPVFVGDTAAIGESRKFNSYMISGDFTYDELMMTFTHYADKRIENTGKTFTFHVPLEVTPEVFLNTLLSKKIIPESYRDISNSTRKLLSDSLAL